MEQIEQWKHLAGFHELKGMGDEELGDYIEGLRVDLQNCNMTNSLPGSLIGFRAVTRELQKALGAKGGKKMRSPRPDESEEEEGAHRRPQDIFGVAGMVGDGVERTSPRNTDEGTKLRNCQQRLPIVSTLIDFIENTQRRHDILVDRCQSQLSLLKNMQMKGDTKSFLNAVRQHTDGIKLSLAFFRVNFESIERLGKSIDASGLLGRDIRFCETFAMYRRFALECLPHGEGMLQAILDQLYNMSSQTSSHSSSFWRLPKKFPLKWRRRISRDGQSVYAPDCGGDPMVMELQISPRDTIKDVPYTDQQLWSKMRSSSC